MKMITEFLRYVTQIRTLRGPQGTCVVEGTLREPQGTGFGMGVVALFFLMAFVLPFGDVNAQNVEVVIKEGPAPVINKRIEERISKLLTSMNTYSAGNSTKIGQGLPSNMTSGEGQYGLDMLKSIVDSTGIVCEESLIETNLISLVDGNYEVRGIPVFMSDKRATEGDRKQELVLEFEPTGVMYSSRLAMETERYNEILSYAQDVQDTYRRKKLIHLLEQFRTAYNMKNLEFIENIFDENALIIIGRRIETKKSTQSAAVNEERQADFELVKKSKTEYIDHLRDKVFKQASFINLEFENIFIYQHPQYADVYGVNLFQKWRSDTYSDDGYLFLMIDYENELEPKIYVRAWQPEPFNDGSVIDMDMFTLVK